MSCGGDLKEGENMNINQLEQYRAKVSEIKLLEVKLQRLKQEAAQPISDSVTGSYEDYPYTKHSITVKGIDTQKRKVVERLIVKILCRQLALKEEQDRILDEIAMIPSSTVRQIIDLKYIQGFTWNNVGHLVYGYPCGDRARKEFIRFIK